MKKQIFRSILLATLSTLTISLILVVASLHVYFEDRVTEELGETTAYLAHGVEREGIGYLSEGLPGDDRVTWVAPDGTVLNSAAGARIVVADTGVGIPREAQRRVFERFYRADQSRSPGGTGLGLSIVKHGAAYLGAQVELESEVGKGSTFTLCFPRITEE